LKLVAHSKYSNYTSLICRGLVSRKGASSTSNKARAQLDKCKVKKEESIFVRDFRKGEQ
jgi:hypothetical protein